MLPTDPQILKRLTALASVSLAFALIVMKAAAFQDSGAVSLLGSLVDSMMDAMASMIAFAGVLLAAQPADREHRWGHGKAEALAALFQALIVTVSALFVAVEAARSVTEPQRLAEIGLGLWVMVVATVATLGLNVLQTLALRRTGSIVIAADRLHYIGDVMMNISVIAALLLASQGWAWWVDPVCGLAIAGFLLFGAARIGRKAINELLDEELADKDRARIFAAVMDVVEVRDAHDLRTRRAGDTLFIECHVELDRDLPLSRVYAVLETVRGSVRARFPGAEIALQPDPYGIVEPRRDWTLE